LTRVRAAVPFALGALVAVVTSCADLRPIDAGTCGNGVVDANEDCDGHPVGAGTACGAAGGPHACRLDCTPDPTTGVAAVCPGGWGCGTDGLCRAPSGRFLASSAPVAANAFELLAGDHDGSGASDLVVREPPGVEGLSKLRAYWFDASGAVAHAQPLPARVGAPIVTDLDGDGLADLGFALAGVGVLRGQPDRTLLPVAYPSYPLPGRDLRMLALRGFPGVPITLLAYLTPNTGPAGLYELDADGGLGSFVLTPRGPDALAGEPVVAHLLDDPASPCEDIGAAFVGSADVVVFSPCRRDGAPGLATAASSVSVALEGGARVDRGLLAADVNLDGHLDLLVGAAGATYVAYADAAGTGFRSGASPSAPGTPNTAAPLLLRITRDDGTTASAAFPFPLAAGDVSGDGHPDYVLPDRVLTSALVTGQTTWGTAYARTRGDWTSAAIADFNGNGRPDVVAGSDDGVDLDFLNGTGSRFLSPFSVTTEGPVHRFSVADVDGDLLPDLVLAVRAVAAGVDEVSVAHGRPSGAFGSVDPVGQLEDVQQTFTFTTATTSNAGLIASFGVVSRPAQPEATPKRVAVSVFSGSSDRQPLAPLALQNIGRAGRTRGIPLALAAGVFTTPPKVARDLVVLAEDSRSDAAQAPAFRLWLLPGEAGATFEPPQMGPALPKDIAPLAGERVAAATAAADLDGDGLAEVVIVTPAGDGRSVIAVARPRRGSGGESTYDAPALTLVEQSTTASSRVAVDDLDGDGRPDVVLLTGGAGTNADLVVYWNAGGGELRAADAMRVGAAGERPRAFALVRAGADGPRAVAYAIDDGVALARFAGRTRQGRRERLSEVDGVTAMAAGDFTGDGVEDVAAAAPGSVLILRGEAILP